jgi:predicted 2-oxoglutarate/Fe(II)-dependent dioxygenase YbiX
MRVGENGFDGGSAKDDNGNLLKQNRSLGLHDIYNYQTNVSHILQYLVKLFHDEDLEKLALHEAGYYYRLYSKARTYYFHLQYYENDDGYESHKDVSVFTNSLILYKDPKNFEGGELVFDEYDYTIPCESNKMIMFPSVLNHSVTPIKMLSDEPMTGRYSITIFQNIK